MMATNKMRIYKKSENLDHEEMFDGQEKMEERYRELYDENHYALNPTAWEWDGGDWSRLAGF